MSPSRRPKSRSPKPTHARHKHVPPAAGPPLFDEDPPAGPVRTEARVLLGSLLQLAARAATAPDKARELLAYADTLDLPAMPEQSAAADLAAPDVPAVHPTAATAETARHPDALVTTGCAAAGVETGQLAAPVAAPACPGAAVRTEWEALGAELAARGPHRVRLALHVVRHTAVSREIGPQEEARLVGWFGALVEEAIVLTGGVARDRWDGEDNPAADALWYLLGADEQQTANVSDRARCPSMAAVGSAGDPGFVTRLVEGAVGYLRTVIAGCGPAEADELRALVGASEATLAGYRPFAFTYESDDEAPAAALLEAALSLATLRRPTPAQRCQGVRAWADGFRLRAHSFVIPPTHRIASVVWLVHELRRGRAA